MCVIHTHRYIYIYIYIYIYRVSNELLEARELPLRLQRARVLAHSSADHTYTYRYINMSRDSTIIPVVFLLIVLLQET